MLSPKVADLDGTFLSLAFDVGSERLFDGRLSA